MTTPTKRNIPDGTSQSKPPPTSLQIQQPLKESPINTANRKEPETSAQSTSNAPTKEKKSSAKSSRLGADASTSSSDKRSDSRHRSLSADWSPVLSDADFETALLEYGRRKCFMLSLFLLCASPGILNGFHVMIYVFYGQMPRHWCTIPILENANWTQAQIRDVSCPSPNEWSNCQYYDMDYEKLRILGYEKAFWNIRKNSKPKMIDCGHFSYEIQQQGTSIVPEWDLVCGRLALKATVQTSISLGKLLGAFAFGTISDKYGRKTSFTIGCFMCMVAGPLVSLTNLYHVMLIARVCLGMASLALYESSYTIISEISPPEKRPILGILFNQSYPMGIVIVAVIGYYIRDWRKLQLCISLPAFLLIFHIWLIPESPRWLYYTGRKRRAWMSLRKFLPPEKNDSLIIRENTNTQNPNVRVSNKVSCYSQVSRTLRNGIRLLSHREFRRRLYVCWAIWCFTALSYYSLSINASHLKADPYLYTALSGVVESISYILALPLLRIFGRRSASSTLLVAAAFSILMLLAVPTNMITSKVIAALFGRLCVSGVFCLVIVHACELFPTTIRNSAIGSSSTWAHVGSTFAPYLVDFFVIYGSWVPNTICGLALLIAALLAQTLPETRSLALYNTLQDLLTRCQANPKERVSFANSSVYYVYEKCRGGLRSASETLSGT